MLSCLMTNEITAAIMIVFAGGPHTPERTALACEILTNHPPPALIYLTGVEYRSEYSNLTERVRSIAAKLPNHPPVLTDSCTTTWDSCRHVVREIQTLALCGAPGGRTSREPSFDHGSAQPRPPEIPNSDSPKSKVESPKLNGSSRLTSYISRFTIAAITSNYHATRVRWLLAGILPSTHITSHVSRLTLVTSSDIPWRDSFATPRNRQLVIGECMSWLYCFPLGLIYRPWWLAVAGFSLISITLVTRPATRRL